jgi:hypothetical protein
MSEVRTRVCMIRVSVGVLVWLCVCVAARVRVCSVCASAHVGVLVCQEWVWQ